MDPMQWLAEQSKAMLKLIREWVAISSTSYDLSGLEEMRQALLEAFSELDARHEVLSLPDACRTSLTGEMTAQPLGKAVRLRKQTGAPIRVLLGGHYDTVFPSTPICEENGRLIASGCADMKGGLVVLLFALRALRCSPLYDRLDWTILLTPDEELGSPGSRELWVEEARQHTLGLIYEPSASNGMLVSERPGARRYTIVAEGREAHAGRDFAKGKNAITALADLIVAVESLNDLSCGLTINIGTVQGGSGLNTVAKVAGAALQVRAFDENLLARTEMSMKDLAHAIEVKRGVHFSIYPGVARPPKPFTSKSEQLHQQFQKCAASLGLTLFWERSGGMTDANLLASQSLPVVDSLGVVGGALHSSEEFMLIESLKERAQLSLLFLQQLAHETRS